MSDNVYLVIPIVGDSPAARARRLAEARGAEERIRWVSGLWWGRERTMVLGLDAVLDALPRPSRAWLMTCVERAAMAP